MDRIEIHYKAQEGGYRIWVMSVNPKCISANCQEIKTAYAINKTNCLRRCFELADYYKDELGQRAHITEIDNIEKEYCPSCKTPIEWIPELGFFACNCPPKMSDTESIRDNERRI